MKRTTHTRHRQTKSVDNWEEGLNKDGASNRRTQRGNYERFVHYGHLLDVDMEGDYACVPPPIQPFQDGGYKRGAVLTYDNWYRVLSEFERGRGWGEGEDYDSSEEEYNCHNREVGPCRKGFGHIEPDTGNLQFECRYSEANMEYDVVGIREKIRKYEQPPFFMPETTQQGFYFETLTGLPTSKHEATILWNNVEDLHFQDGRIPDFITDSVRGVCAAIKQTIARVRNTIDKLK